MIDDLPELPAPADVEVLNPAGFERSFAETGTIGWSGDDTVEDIEPSGVTYVKVTLFKGHASGAPTTPDGAANGHPILARLSGPAWAVPRKGTQCVVVFPGGDAEAPGCGIAIPIAATPDRQFDSGSVVLDYSGYDVVIKGKSVALISEDDDKRQVVSVSARGGVQCTDDTGSGFLAKDGEINIKAIDSSGNIKSYLVLDADGLNAVAGSSALILDGKSFDVSFLGRNFICNVVGGVFLGATATLTNTVTWASVNQSTKVFVAP